MQSQSAAADADRRADGLLETMTSTDEHMDDAGGMDTGDRAPGTGNEHTGSSGRDGPTDTKNESEVGADERAESLDRLGRQLATDLFEEMRPKDGADNGDPIEDVLRAGEQRLTRHGVQLEV